MTTEELKQAMLALVAELRDRAKQPGHGDYYCGMETAYESSADEVEELLNRWTAE